MRHQNDACPSPPAATATFTSPLRSKSHSSRFENQTGMRRQTLTDQHQQRHCCCHPHQHRQREQLANGSNKSPTRSTIDQSPIRPVRAEEATRPLSPSSSSSSIPSVSYLTPQSAEASPTLASQYNQSQDTSYTNKNMTIAAATDATGAAEVETDRANVFVKCEKLVVDRNHHHHHQVSGVGDHHDNVRPTLNMPPSRKRRRARICSSSSGSSSSRESSPHMHDDSLATATATATSPRPEVTQQDNATTNKTVEPMTPVQSPQPADQVALDAESQSAAPGGEEDSSVIEATFATALTDSLNSPEPTTTMTNSHLHPTNHQRALASPAEETRENDDDQQSSIRHQQQQQLQFRQQQPEKITEAQLDRLNTLIKLIRQGSYNEFTELLGERKFKNLLNVFVDGHTALHYTLIYGRSIAWCKQLVSNGANPNLTNRSGWHPIHLAAFNGSRETMRYLIDCIAN